MSETICIDKDAYICNSSSIGFFFCIGRNTRIGERVRIGSHVCISENVLIGDDCISEDKVTICDNVEIGNNTFIGAGTAFVSKINQRARAEVPTAKTSVGNNVYISPRAVIEADCVLDNNTVINYGEIISK